MDRTAVFRQLSESKITKQDAYKQLYPASYKKRGKPHFIYLNINVKDEPVANVFLALLFLLPIPLVLGKMVLRFIGRRQKDLSTDDIDLILESINKAKGTKVHIDSDDAKVKISIF